MFEPRQMSIPKELPSVVRGGFRPAENFLDDESNDGYQHARVDTHNTTAADTAKQAHDGRQ
jgi:hypothetical protein